MLVNSYYVGLVLGSLSAVEAHITMWNKGLFGYNYPGQAGDAKQYWSTNAIVTPLRKFDNLKEEQWFAHGMKKYPPKDGDFMELVSGEDYLAELSCNRAYTAMQSPADYEKEKLYYACPTSGPLHTYNRYGKEPDITYLSGTAIAIAYTSDIDTVKPTDFTVITTNHTSVWTRQTVYPIPAGMPQCGKGGCLCTWNWFHQYSHGEGYGQEMYNNLYRCRVSGQTDATNAIALGRATVPKDCSSDSSACTKGPKQPMYLFQTTGNNMEDPGEPPAYNMRYGFPDGAQNDVFIAASLASLTASPASSALGKTIGLLVALFTSNMLSRLY